MSGLKTCALPPNGGSHKIGDINPVATLTSTNKGDLEREMASIRQSMSELRKCLLNTFTVPDLDRKHFDFDHLPGYFKRFDTAQAIPTAANTAIVFDRIIFDTYDYVNAVALPTAVINFLVGGVYRINIQIEWAADAAGTRLIWFSTTGPGFGAALLSDEEPGQGGITFQYQRISMLQNIASNATGRVMVNQTSGGPLDARAHLMIERIRPNWKPPERGRVAGRFEQTVETDVL